MHTEYVLSSIFLLGIFASVSCVVHALVHHRLPASHVFAMTGRLRNQEEAWQRQTQSEGREASEPNVRTPWCLSLCVCLAKAHPETDGRWTGEVLPRSCLTLSIARGTRAELDILLVFPHPRRSSLRPRPTLRQPIGKSTTAPTSTE